MAQDTERVPRLLTKRNLKRRGTWRRQRREAVAATKADRIARVLGTSASAASQREVTLDVNSELFPVQTDESNNLLIANTLDLDGTSEDRRTTGVTCDELQYVAPSSAQRQGPKVVGSRTERKRCASSDSHYGRNGIAQAPASPSRSTSKCQKRHSSSSADDVDFFGSPSTLDDLGIVGEQAKRLETSLSPTPKSLGGQLESGDSFWSAHSPGLDDRLLSITPELSEPQGLCAAALPSVIEDETGFFSGDDESTELILTELSQIASQHHKGVGSNFDSFFPPDSTALWIAASSQVERAEQSFFGSKAYAKTQQLNVVAAERTLPAPLTSFEQPSEPAALPGYQLSWRSEPVGIPLDATRIYAVRRGRNPGFYFAFEGQSGAEAQVRGFEGCLYQWYLIDEVGLEDACAFMNHDP
ncbi:hypothetical protein LTR36_007830, partial [Oleoguttula mirabilis]